MTFALLMISILSCILIFLICFSIQNSSALYFGHDIPIVTNLGNSSILPIQVAATEKGDVYLTWVDNNNIYFTSSHNNGDKFSSPILLADNNTSSLSSSSSSPQITATEKGDVYLTWVELNNSTGDSNIEFINSNNGGQNFTAKKELRGGDTLSFSPQIAATEKGDVYVVWVDKSSKTGDTDITFRSSNDSGKNFDNRERLRRNNLLSSSPQVTATEKGGVYLVWTDKNSTTTKSQISFRSSSDSGKNFERIINLNKDEENLLNSSSPQIVATPNNSAFVVWVDNHIQFREILVNDSVVGVPISLSNKTITSLSPQLAVANNGNVYVFWIDKDGIMDRSIHFKRINEEYFDRNS